MKLETIYKVHDRTDEEIIFKSLKDLQGFFNAVSNGSWVLVEYEKDKKKHGEVISPDISADIRDKKITIRSEEDI